VRRPATRLGLVDIAPPVTLLDAHAAQLQIHKLDAQRENDQDPAVAESVDICTSVRADIN